MTLAIVVLVAVGALWLPDLVAEFLEERRLPGFENGTKAWKRWGEALRLGERAHR